MISKHLARGRNVSGYPQEDIGRPVLPELADACAASRLTVLMAFLIAGDSAPLRRTSEPPLECRRFAQGTKAVPDRVLRQIDIHVAFEVALFEPIQNVHCRFIERQRDLVRIRVEICLKWPLRGPHVP